MDTKVKIGIAAAIVVALGAVIGYDLMHAKGKPAGDATQAAVDSGLKVVTEGDPGQSASPNGTATVVDLQRSDTQIQGPVAPPSSLESERIIAPAAPAPADPAAPEEYVVQPDETLAYIAEKKYGDPNKWTLIARANPKVNPNRMRIGTKLVIPNAAAPVAEVAAAPAPDLALEPAPADGSPRTYVIKAGDMLSHIAKRFYGTTAAVAKIREANADILADANILTEGVKIVLPESAARPATSVSVGEPGSNHTTAQVDPKTSTGRTHTIAQGDSLWKIAAKHHGGQGVLSFMERIVASNSDKLSSTSTPLRVGWTLAIPAAE